MQMNVIELTEYVLVMFYMIPFHRNPESPNVGWGCLLSYQNGLFYEVR